jgi:signal transduction histidine kinase
MRPQEAGREAPPLTDYSRIQARASALSGSAEAGAPIRAVAKGPRLGIRVRLTALFVAIFGITLVVFSIIVYRVFTQNLQNEFDADLFNHALDVSQGIEVDVFGNVAVSPDVLSSGGKIFPFSVGSAFLQLSTLDGRIIARSRSLGKAELPHSAADLRTLKAQGAVFRTLSPEEFAVVADPPSRRNIRRNQHRLLNYLVVKGDDVMFILQIAVPLTLVDQESQGLITFFMLLIPLTLIVAAFGGLYLSRRALAPVAAMIDKARSLSPERLSERIPVPGTQDEIRQLALTLNGLLDRLQQAFESQERFVADASHQLKTPLAILRGELDLLRKRERPREETEAFLGSAAQELEYLSRMVEDLLLLARVDAGEAALSAGAVRLDELALEAVSRLKPLATTRGVSIRFDLDCEHGEPEYEVRGDSDLLRSLLQSLIENAIKYSPTVQVTVSSEADWVWVRIKDDGPGIPPEDLPRIFERFYRAHSQPKGTGGTGLGLAIAKRISEVHHGLLLAESELGRGSQFSFGLRRARGQTP